METIRTLIGKLSQFDDNLPVCLATQGNESYEDWIDKNYTTIHDQVKTVEVSDGKYYPGNFEKFGKHLVLK